MKQRSHLRHICLFLLLALFLIAFAGTAALADSLAGGDNTSLMSGQSPDILGVSDGTDTGNPSDSTDNPVTIGREETLVPREPGDESESSATPGEPIAGMSVIEESEQQNKDDPDPEESEENSIESSVQEDPGKETQKPHISSSKGNDNSQNTIKNKKKFVENEILVKFRDDERLSENLKTYTRNNVHMKTGGTLKRDFKNSGQNGLQLVAVPEGKSVEEVIEEYENDPSVEYAQPNYILSIPSSPEGISSPGGEIPDELFPDDTYFPLQWALSNSGQVVNGDAGSAGSDIGILQVWDVTQGSNDVLIAVIDTGVDTSHPDLSGNIWTNAGEISGNGLDDDNNGYIDDYQGYNFVDQDGDPSDDNGHGTHCAGTIGASGNNGIGVSGVAWNAGIMPLKCLNSQGYGSTADAIEAIGYASMMGADIVSVSWGCSEYDQALYNAISQSPALFVCAAGNSGQDNDVYPVYPASFNCDNIISVAATGQDDGLASFSNRGPSSVDLGAPGTNIISNYPSWKGDPYVFMSGTSMAVPYVAGVAGLVKAAEPEIDSSELRMRILESVDRIDSLDGKTVTGGRLNAAKAFGLVESTPVPTAQETVGVTTIPTTVNPETPVGSGDLEEVRLSISANDMDWVASETSISAISDEEFENMLGLIPAPISSSEYTPEDQTSLEILALPSSIDWRNNGGDYTTPVKNQGGCGSCWAFATIGTFESRTEIATGNPTLNPDYSEQDLVSCAGCGGCGGSNMICPQNWLLYHGTVSESCFPYVAWNAPCKSSCTPHYNIYEWHRITPIGSEYAIKEALTRGPVIGTFAVYDDFRYYGGGVYEHSWGAFAGYHAIVIVGWGTDSKGTYWICKNSWGTSWGENGWFKIRSGNVGINNELYELNVQAPLPVAGFYGTPGEGVKPLTVQFTDTSTNSPTSWQWDVDGDSVIDYTEPDPIHTYENTGTCTVTLTVTNTFGSDTLTKTDYISVVSPPQFISGWSYRKLHTIAGSPDGDLTDYQMKFVVHRTDGTDSGEDVYVGTNCNEDYSDIRFTTIDNTPVPYWIEEIGTDYAVVWVKVPSIPTSGTQIYLYYGNPVAESASNGDETFVFFDDFNETALNSTKWTSFGSPAVAGSVVTIQNPSSAGIYSNYAFDTGHSLLFRAELNHNAVKNGLFAGFYANSPTQERAAVVGGLFGHDYFESYMNYNGATSTSNFGNAFEGDYHTWEIIRRPAAATVVYAIDNTTIYTGSSNIARNNDLVRFHTASSSNSIIYLEWVCVRKYIDSEPAHGTWDIPEINTIPPIAEFSAAELSSQAPFTVQFTDLSTGPGIDQWQWNFGDGSDNSTNQNPSHTYESEGSYTVSLTVTNGYGTSTIKKKY